MTKYVVTYRWGHGKDPTPTTHESFLLWEDDW